MSKMYNDLKESLQDAISDAKSSKKNLKRNYISNTLSRSPHDPHRKKSLSHKYSWGNSVSKAKIKTDKISLPTKDGKPDYKTMELLISAIQKLVIKDIVQFTNRKLDTYKNIVSKSSFRYQISEQRSMIAASADKPCLDY